MEKTYYCHLLDKGIEYEDCVGCGKCLATTEAQKPGAVLSNSTDWLAVLLSYRCQYTTDMEGDGMGLVDLLTPPGENTIAEGLKELELLVDHLFLADR